MPLAMYGYMRLTTINEDESEAIRHELVEHAGREGFNLEQVFIERLNAEESALLALIDALKATEVKNVIVPSLWHFARLPGLQAAVREHIEQEIGARLWIVHGGKAR